MTEKEQFISILKELEIERKWLSQYLDLKPGTMATLLSRPGATPRWAKMAILIYNKLKNEK